MRYWYFPTKRGTFKIVPRTDGYGFDFWFDDNCMDGPFHTAQQAAESIAGNASPMPFGINPERLGVPEELEKWRLG